MTFAEKFKKERVKKELTPAASRGQLGDYAQNDHAV